MGEALPILPRAAMNDSEAATVRRAWIRERSYRRVTEAVWPFSWRGAIPTIGLALLAIYGFTRFATHHIERDVLRGTTIALSEQGYDWVRVDVSGQHVSLSGDEPGPGEGERAIAIAEAARCDSWTGLRKCATRVAGSFGAVVESRSAAEVAPPPAARAEAAEACEVSLNDLVADTQIQFETASATIDPSANPLLDAIADVAGECLGVVVVEGHTDATGEPEANQRLSELRAEAVTSALALRGIAQDRLRSIGFGETRPIADNATSAGRAQNRRIVFRVEM